jgi:hypothetical protein
MLSTDHLRAAQDAGPTISGLQVGFAGLYKLGCWTPLSVELTAGTEPVQGELTVTVPDGDGVPTTVSRSVTIAANNSSVVRLLVRVGKPQGPFRVRLCNTAGKQMAARTLAVAAETGRGVVAAPLSVTGQLFVQIGPSIGLADLLFAEGDTEATRSEVAALPTLADLPEKWVGYEGIDTVVLTTSDPAIFAPTPESEAPLRVLQEWVEMGGKLVLFCGERAEQFFGPEGLLSPFVSARFVDLIDLQETQALEVFSGTEQALTPNRRIRLQVPRFADIRGNQLALAGRGARQVPLVIQWRLGFGEVVLVGLDFDREPFRSWKGRQSFLAKALQLSDQNAQSTAAGTTPTSNNDLMTPIETVLDESLPGARPVSFGLVALLVAGYLALIGPGDYFLTNQVLKKPLVTWISFPLLVAAVSAGVFFVARWYKGDQVRSTQVEFIDIDAASGRARGTAWTHFFSPQAAVFDLTFQPRFQKTTVEGQTCVSWLGQPGPGLGGMQSGSNQATMFDRGYAFAPALDAMHEVPVEQWSTKTLTARWVAQIDCPVAAALHQAEEQLVEGHITNEGGESLEDCILLYGQWAWKLGPLAPGATVDLVDESQPRMVRTLLTSATAGDATITDTADDGTVPFHLARNDLTRLAKTVMFFDAINGHRYTSMLSNYQQFLDMSPCLAHPECAVLLTRCSQQGGQWLSGDKPLGGKASRQWTYYRFVLPVELTLHEGVSSSQSAIRNQQSAIQ